MTKQIKTTEKAHSGKNMQSIFYWTPTSEHGYFPEVLVNILSVTPLKKMDFFYFSAGINRKCPHGQGLDFVPNSPSPCSNFVWFELVNDL